MREKLKKIIENGDGVVVSRRLSISYFKKNYPDFYLRIEEAFSKNMSFQEKLYLIYYNLDCPPICHICNNYVTFNKFSQGYSRYCSLKCVGLDKEVQKKREDTTKKLYGGKYTLTSPVLRKKVKKTNIERHGTEHPQKLENIKNKIKQTNLERHGVIAPQKSKKIREKTIQTNLEKYGVENVNQNKTIKEKAKQTNLERYGGSSPMASPDIRNKIKQTNFEKYNSKYFFQTDEFKEKAKQTNLERYGVEQPQKLEHIKQKTIKKLKKTKKEQSIKYWANKLNIEESNIEIDDFNNITIKNYCHKHESFTINNMLLKNRIGQKINNICTKCNPLNENISIKEKELKDYILHIIDNFNLNNRKIIPPYELDIYIPDKNIAIEFNGLYWHSNKYVDKNYHLNKTELCRKQNIQLLHIFEDEWGHKKDIVKSIINAKLNLINSKIYARKTEIKEIEDNKIIKDFLEENHIQGFVGSKVKLGLYYNNELVSLMTFGKPRKALGAKSKENEYELLRFCNKLNTNIIGGASKLLKYFIKNYNPKKITTYADRRYSNGNLYKTLGFEFIGETKPNYWYYNNKAKDLTKYHRFNFRKDVLIKEGYNSKKTEKEIMLERGYLWIYDCGNYKYEMVL
jgi:hypothetical protein